MKKRSEHEDFKLESFLGLILITVALCTMKCDADKVSEIRKTDNGMCNEYVSLAKRKACIESVNRWENLGY